MWREIILSFGRSYEEEYVTAPAAEKLFDVR